MPSRNVAVQADAYAKLQREKRPGESFTQLFLRLLSQRGSLEELSGAWGKAGRATLRRWRAIRDPQGR